MYPCYLLDAPDNLLLPNIHMGLVKSGIHPLNYSVATVGPGFSALSGNVICMTHKAVCNVIVCYWLTKLCERFVNSSISR